MNIFMIYGYNHTNINHIYIDAYIYISVHPSIHSRYVCWMRTFFLYTYIAFINAYPRTQYYIHALSTHTKMYGLIIHLHLCIIHEYLLVPLLIHDFTSVHTNMHAYKNTYMCTNIHQTYDHQAYQAHPVTCTLTYKGLLYIYTYIYIMHAYIQKCKVLI